MGEIDRTKVVYTAISGGKDQLVEEQETAGATFIAWLDHVANPTGIAQTGSWYVKKIHPFPNIDREDYVRQAKMYKVMPHLYLKDTEYSLWMDGNLRLKVPMQVLIDKYLGDADIAFFKHPLRDCIYDEAQVCRELVLDNVFAMEIQMRKYKKMGYPEHNGLIDGSVILRRHTPKIQEINTAWHKEIMMGSRRDQLSFNFVAWKYDLKYNLMEGFNHVGSNEFFEMVPHLRERN